MFFHPLWTVIYLMLISSNGFFFLGALPPTQLMGLTGTGQAADDTRWGLDPAQPPRENAWGRTASQEESRAQLCPAHTTAGGSLGCPSGPGQARGASQPHPMSQAWGCVPSTGLLPLPCSTDPLRAVPLQVVLQQRCAFFPSLERFETLVGRYNKPENKLALP